MTRGTSSASMTAIIYTPKMIDDIKERVAAAIARQGSLRLSDSKAVLGYGRSNAAAVYEYLDDIGFTCRRGNVRTLTENSQCG